MPSSLLVSVGILTNLDNQILITADKKTPNIWGYPGGKLNQLENFADCLIRELKEELNIVLNSDCISLIYYNLAQNVESDLTLAAFRCYNWQGTISALESQSLMWIKPTDLDKYQMHLANYQLNKVIAELF